MPRIEFYCRGHEHEYSPNPLWSCEWNAKRPLILDPVKSRINEYVSLQCENAPSQHTLTGTLEKFHTPQKRSNEDSDVGRLLIDLNPSPDFRDRPSVNDSVDVVLDWARNCTPAQANQSREAVLPSVITSPYLDHGAPTPCLDEGSETKL